MDSAWLPNVFLDYVSSDVQLRIHTTDQDSEAVVPAHSLVLRLASKVFKAMLETANFKEGRTGIVEMKVNGNMDDAFFFLRYLYTRDLEHVDMPVYISVLQTAHLYEVDDLVRLCNKRIAEQVTPLAVCRAYGSLKNVASEDLLAHCESLMLEFAFLIFKKNLHMTLDEDMMCCLLASDELNVLNEEQALIALWRWGCAQLALKGCPEENVEIKIKTFLIFIRRPLITNVSESSPWFRLWKELMPGTGGNEYSPLLETRGRTGQPNIKDKLNKSSQVGNVSQFAKVNSSPVTDVLRRQPNVENKLNRFCQVACLSERTNNTKKSALKTTDNCLMIFSLDQNILFSGFTIQVIVGEKLNSRDIFQFSVIQEDVTQLGSPEMVLVNEYSIQKVPVVHTSRDPKQMQMGSNRNNAYNVREWYDCPGVNNQQYPTMNNLSSASGRNPTNTANLDYSADKTSDGSQTKDELFYVYDLTINLRTPIVLKTEKRTVLDLNIKKMPKSGISLKNFSFPQNHTLNFNQNVKIRLWQNMVGVSQLYYFL